MRDGPGSERVLLVGSSGGHLAQLLALRGWWEGQTRAWVCFDTLDATSALSAEPETYWAYHPTTRHIPNLLRNTWLAIQVMHRFRPTMVVSTGAAVALPFFILARVMGVRTVYIEVYDRIEKPALTSKLCEPFTDVFLVQWQEQLKLFRRARLLGRLL